jgi:hypothetical protein
MGRCARWISHIMQAVEECDEIEVLAGIVLRGGDFEASVGGDAVFCCVRLSGFDRAGWKS